MRKISERKPSIVRLDDDDLNYITERGRGYSFNESISSIVRGLRAVEAQGLAELHGYFTKDEWKYMANVIKRCDMTFDRNVLILKLADLKKTLAYGSLFDVDISRLTTKISQLGAHHTFAIVERINIFWHTDCVDIDKWSNY